MGEKCEGCKCEAAGVVDELREEIESLKSELEDVRRLAESPAVWAD